jgi:hypothetical protein
MAFCRHCGKEVDWGFDPVHNRWVPLEPVATHDDLPRTFLDENGVLRADHRDRDKQNSSGVNVTRLDKKIPAELAKEHQGAIVRAARRKKAV